MIYAKTVNPEYVDTRMYLDDIFENDDYIMLDGGRHYISYNDEVLNKIKDAIDNYYELEYHYNFHTISEYVNWYLPKKKNKKAYSPRELHQIEEYIKQEDILGLLSVIKGVQYKAVGLRGCSQGDYVTLYAPVNTNQEYIEYIESVYWNLGTEIIIHDDIEPVRKPQDISGYSFYSAEYREEELIEEIKQRACRNAKEKVKLFVFDGYIHTPKYRVIK